MIIRGCYNVAHGNKIMAMQYMIFWIDKSRQTKHLVIKLSKEVCLDVFVLAEAHWAEMSERQMQKKTKTQLGMPN